MKTKKPTTKKQQTQRHMLSEYLEAQRWSLQWAGMIFLHSDCKVEVGILCAVQNRGGGGGEVI